MSSPSPSAEAQAQFFAALKQQLPDLKSQAQFHAFQAAFEAFRGVMNSIFRESIIAEKEAMDALGKAFDVAKQATKITNQLADSPEAATSKTAEDFKQPPAEFQEYDVQRALFTELVMLSSLDDLTEWYRKNRNRIDLVRSASLRNPLLDAIREKKLTFDQASTNGKDQP
jgi:hypothetical protein